MPPCLWMDVTEMQAEGGTSVRPAVVNDIAVGPGLITVAVNLM